jgi:predicted ATP-grasp superfamily ATP-dependent carboligase
VHPHPLGLPLGTEFATGVLEVANQFLLFRVDRNRRFASGERRFDRGIDVRELRIAIRVVAALSGLPGWLGNYISDRVAGSPPHADWPGTPVPTAP